MNWRTPVRIFIESFGELLIILVAIQTEKVIASFGRERVIKIICAVVLLSIGVGLRIFGDQVTIAINEGTLLDRLFNFNF